MQEKFFTLLQLNKSIRNLIASINREFWIAAEIAHIQIQEHAYLELVQKDNEKIVAKARGIIWNNVLQELFAEHPDILPLILRAGVKMRCRVAVNFHEVHGLSLQITAVDTVYSLGEMESLRLQTLAQLEQSGLLHLQQNLSLPPVIQKIAVVSSENAAGLGDFLNQLEKNRWGYRFAVTVFPTGVQGEHAAVGLAEQIGKVNRRFDVLAIIRGGGARLDLEVFNTRTVAAAVALCPVPVLTGIGHQRDTTVTDLCAHLALKTPTAVAEFILQNNLEFENNIVELTQKIALRATGKLNEEKAALNALQTELGRVVYEKITAAKLMHQKTQIGISIAAAGKMQSAKHNLKLIEEFFRLSNPDYLLKKGYFLVKKQRYLKAPDLRENMQVSLEGENAAFEIKICKKIK